MKSKLQVGDTIRLKQHLEISKDYDGLIFLKGMNYGFDRLTVVGVDDISQNTVLKGPDGYHFYYSFAMLDFRTIRRKKD